MPKQFLCFHCKSWHFDRFCPDCGVPSGAGANSHLYTSMLNNQLYDQANSAEKTKAEYRALRKGHDIPVPKWAKKRAREIVSEM